LTEGHAFWLDLLAIQVGKQHGAAKLHTLVSQIGSGSGLLPEKTLNSIWNTLPDRAKVILNAMAETVKPVTELELGDYLSDQLTFNKVMRTLNNLRTLNLVVVKRRPNEPDVLELHPLVRVFIRNNFPEKERRTFIGAIIKSYQKWMNNHKGDLRERPSLLVLQYWTQTAELDVRAGQFEDAFLALAEVGQAFFFSPYRREFTRATRMLLDAVNWIENHAIYKTFEGVFKTHVCILADLGEHLEVDRLLDRYEVTVANKDARYINYCDMRCYVNWVRGNFDSAITWGKTGQELKTSTGVATKFDVSHNLALALRDAGHPESVLPIFLRGRMLAQVTDPDELEEERGGHYYGNIGRCLHFMGQIEDALICYQKSALLLEKDRAEHVVNEGFVRAWIAELLLSRKQLRLGYAFYRAAYRKWKQTAPPRAAQVEKISLQLKQRLGNSPSIDDSEAERICVDWIVGKYLDSDIIVQLNEPSIK
jgi:tetratricopeptide (TPR) repeat protein